MTDRKKPVLLCILDGWGYNPNKTGNAIEEANTPNWHRMLNEYPHGLLDASGTDVGLPRGQMGNSEVGHTNIGAGRVVLQLLGQIEQAIQTDTLKSNPYLLEFIKKVKDANGACHLFGLLSDGGVHAHIDHIIALAKALDANNIKTYIHVATDGRDTPPSSAVEYVKQFIDATKDCKNVSIATISGRYYSMDRNKTWDRTKLAYDAMTIAKSESKFTNPVDAIEASYKNGKTDEFIVPTVNENYHGMNDGDGVLIANFRADRVRQIASALADPDFKDFTRQKVVKFSALLGMAEYSEELNKLYKTLFPAVALKHIFGEEVANAGLKQLRIAETEKYAHVTFFFNGGEEKVFPNEDRILIPSPSVATYDLKPEMSAYEITDNLEKVIAEDKYDTIILNYANGDMVGHTGIMSAAKKAAETLDNCIARLEKAILAKNGAMLIIADHGNCEKMVDENGEPFTAHTTNKVFSILVSNDKDIHSLHDGKLADVAPTLLKLLNLPIPSEMTGKPLF